MIPHHVLLTLLHNLDNDTMSVIVWFGINYMELNQQGCNFIISGNTPEDLWAKQDRTETLFDIKSKQNKNSIDIFTH